MNDDNIRSATEKLKKRLVPEHNHGLPDWALVTAILGWEGHTEGEVDEASLDSEEFQTFLGEHVRRIKENGMYTGSLSFSFEKLAAMTSYIASSGNDVSKTKLNKLLFYSDFVNYFLHGKSISGSRYMHMHYGPVAEYYRETLETLSEENKLHTIRTDGHDEILADGSEALDVLTFLEIASLDWVLNNFGSLTAHEISEHSHDERAFRFTRQGEFIPYEFAKYLQRLPEPTPPCSRTGHNGH
ncbi:MAG TPA: Panacea domain-containing protein [Pyrinomonadaceae bacterium]|nr:Panacea domain-containing protein [Pyrinomonadaceae bacterium]